MHENENEYSAKHYADLIDIQSHTCSNTKIDTNLGNQEVLKQLLEATSEDICHISDSEGYGFIEDEPEENELFNCELEISKDQTQNNKKCRPSCFCGLQNDKQMIECKTCQAYVHYGCTNLPKYQIIIFEQTSRFYMCASCATKKFRILSKEVNFCSLPHRPTTEVDSHTQADSFTQTDTRTQSDSYTQADSYSSNVTHADSCTINQQLQSINRSLNVVMEETISLSLEQRISGSAQINVSEKINDLEKAKQLHDYEKKLLNKEIQLYQRENKQLKAELDKKPDTTKLQQVNYDSALENENLKLKMKELELSIQFRGKETEMIRKNHETEIDLLKKQIQMYQRSSSQLEQSRKPIIQYETQAHEVPSCQVFAGCKNALSNFFPCQLYYEGQSFACSEHLYQYLKAEYHDQPEICHEIINCRTANQVMYVGRKIVPSRSWYDCCDQKMNFVLELKKQNNVQISKKL